MSGVGIGGFGEGVQEGGELGLGLEEVEGGKESGEQYQNFEVGVL